MHFLALIIHLFIETAAKKTSPSSLSKVEARLPVGHSGHSDTFLGFEYKETKLMMYHNIYSWTFFRKVKEQVKEVKTCSLKVF